MYRSDLVKIVGYIDPGLLGRCNKIVNHALAFMVQVIERK